MLSKKNSRFGIVLCVIVFVAGCATIGPAPGKLSAEVGDRISEMQGLHQLTLKSYFESERKRIETFLEERWIPLFLRNFLGTSGLMKDLEAAAFVSEEDQKALIVALQEYLVDEEEAAKAIQDIVDSVSGFRQQESDKVREILNKYVEDDKLDAATVHVSSLLQVVDPAFLMIEWVTDAQAEIELQRKKMLEPLEEAERTITAELAQAYAEMLKANGVVTARLEAAAKVKESRDSLLQAFEARQHADLLRHRLAEISDTVGKALGVADSVLSAADTEETSLQKVTAAIEALMKELRTITDRNNQ